MKKFEVNKALAEVVYEQIAGTTSGHMANVPNNPALFSITSAITGTHDNCYAASKTDFAEMLRQIAAQLAEEPAF